MKPKMDRLLASIFDGFGRLVGKENRAKSEQKSIKKRIEKMLKENCVLDAVWTPLAGGGNPRAGHRGAGILGHPN